MRITSSLFLLVRLIYFVNEARSVAVRHVEADAISFLSQQSHKEDLGSSLRRDITPGQPLDPQDVCRNATCWIQGQQDLYGFGTRVGIYLTWSASLIANNWLPEEYDNALDSNTVFLFALTVVVVYYASKRQLRALDVVIILQLCLGFILTVMTVWGYRTSVYWRERADGVERFGGTGTYIRLFILSAITGYSLWFWSVGYKDASLEFCKMYESCHLDLRLWIFGTAMDLQDTPSRVLYIGLTAVLSGYYLGMLLTMVSGCIRRRGRPLPPVTGGSRLRKWVTLRAQRRHYTRFGDNL